MKDIAILLPEIIIASTMLTIFVVGMFVKNRIVFTSIGVVGVILAYICMQGISGTAFDSMVRLDDLSKTFKTIILLAITLTLLISNDYKHIDDKRYSEYCSLIMLSGTGMMLMASASDMLILYLSLELMSLSIYVLTGFKRDDERANEAALKYFLLGTLGAIIFLFSLTLVYGITGTTNIYKIADYIKFNGLVSNPLLLLAVSLSLTTFAFKIAAVPFHQWSPDVYEGAPTTITAFMSVAPKAAVFAAFGRVFYDSFLSMHANWSEFMIIISVLTMALGNLLAMAQTNMKRMLAYSSIAHAGYMLLGIASATYVSINAIAFYLIAYAFMNIGAFAIITSIEKGESIDTYKGLFKREPFKAFGMLVIMSALTGLPPTAGFVAKLNLFMAVIQAGYVIPVIFAVIFSILSAFYYLRVVAYMFFARDVEVSVCYLPAYILNIAIFITVVFVCLIGVMPSFLGSL